MEPRGQVLTSPTGVSDEGGLRATLGSTHAVTQSLPLRLEPPAPLFLDLAEAASRWMRDKLGRSRNRKGDCLSELGREPEVDPLRGGRGPPVDCL